MNTDIEIVEAALRDGINLRKKLAEEGSRHIATAAGYVSKALQSGGKLLLCGNGGSAADCQHIAAELTGRFSGLSRQALPAVALTTDSSALTAIANDFGYDYVFSRQVEALGRSGDVLLCISTSGRSPSILHAARAGKALGLTVLGLTGPGGGPLGEVVDLCICVPGATTDRIQELHITVGHIVCSLVEQAMQRLAVPAPAQRAAS